LPHSTAKPTSGMALPACRIPCRGLPIHGVSVPMAVKALVFDIREDLLDRHDREGSIHFPVPDRPAQSRRE